MQAWAITDAAGAVVQQVFSDGDPFDTGAATMQDGYKAVAVPRMGRLEREKLVNGAWEPDMHLLRPRLIERVEQEREAEQQRYLTPGAGKMVAYRQKAAEVEAYYAMDPGERDGLTEAERRERFPMASAEIELGGGRKRSLDDVIAYYALGMSRAHAKVFRLEALADAAKTKILAANTRQAAVAAANVDWSKA